MTDLVPVSLAAELAALRKEVAEIRAVISRNTLTPLPIWVPVWTAAMIEGVSVSTINRQVRNGERESNGKSGSARRVRVER